MHARLKPGFHRRRSFNKKKKINLLSKHRIIPRYPLTMYIFANWLHDKYT